MVFCDQIIVCVDPNRVCEFDVNGQRYSAILRQESSQQVVIFYLYSKPFLLAKSAPEESEITAVAHPAADYMKAMRILSSVSGMLRTRCIRHISHTLSPHKENH